MEPAKHIFISYILALILKALAINGYLCSQGFFTFIKVPINFVSSLIPEK